MKKITDASIDMVMCDPPYGTTACRWDSVIPLDELWAEYLRICKPNAAIVLMANQPFASTLIASNQSMYRHEWLWEKDKAGNFAAAKYQPMKNYENCLVFSATKPVRYFPIKTARETPITRGKSTAAGAQRNAASSTPFSGHQRKVFTDRFPTAIIRGIGVVRRTIHPSQKPVALMEYLIKTYTKPGDTVLDNAMGSGTTGVACANTGRRFVGIERDPEYFEVATERIQCALNRAKVSQNTILP
jgi:site-specific DNA-methyltransferase (adenine-specific)